MTHPLSNEADTRRDHQVQRVFPLAALHVLDRPLPNEFQHSATRLTSGLLNQQVHLSVTPFSSQARTSEPLLKFTQH